MIRSAHLPRLAFAALALACPTRPALAQTCHWATCPGPPSALGPDLHVLVGLDGDALELHLLPLAVPPAEFVWVTPTPPDVRVRFSDRAAFGITDVNYSVDLKCPDCLERDFPASPYPLPTLPDGPVTPQVEVEVAGVEVVERRMEGPYDVAVLDPADAGALVDWLIANGFPASPDAAAGLAPYIGDPVFVAVRLAEAVAPDERPPISLRYPADAVRLPVPAWSAVAPPETGVVLTAITPTRAVPLGATLAWPNLTLVDWMRCGYNQRDVAAAAFLELGEPAWVTDGDASKLLGWRDLYDRFDLVALAAARVLGDVVTPDTPSFDPALHPILREVITPPEGVDVEAIIRCPQCFELQLIPVDGPALAAYVEAVIIPPRAALNAVVRQNERLTRLFALIGPGWPVADVTLGADPALGELLAVREADAHFECDGGIVLETEDGGRYRAAPDGSNPVAWLWGDAPPPVSAVTRAVRYGADGTAETIVDNREAVAAYFADRPRPEADAGLPADAGLLADGGGLADAGPVLDGDVMGDAGCACEAGGGGPGGLWPALLALVGLLRGRRS